MSKAIDFEECHCSAVRRAARQVTQLYDRELAGSGLRTTQFSILRRLRKHGPMMIHALASELAMDRTTLSRNVLPLERDGLLAIGPSPHDRRAKALQLTAEGARRLRAAEPHWQAAQRAYEDAVGRKRSHALRDDLRDVVASVGAITGDESQGTDDA